MSARPARPSPASRGTYPLPGSVVDNKYVIEEVLGDGGMGVVLAARHAGLQQRFAIKFLISGLHEPDVVRRFMQEARAASELKSEHVVRVSDVGELPSGQPYMVMEYLEGDDLAERLDEHGPLRIAEAVGYLLQACEALAEAHRRGIVHRDLKPGNLFLTRRPDGTAQIKVVDFGVSKIDPRSDKEPGFHVTSGRSLLGSPYYMSPEQIRGLTQVDARTDIWSLGVTLYELLTGHRPFFAKTIPALAVCIVSDPFTPVTRLRPEVPSGLESIIRRCLSKDPELRFQTVAELASALAPFAGSDARIAARRAVRISRQSGADNRPGGASDDRPAADTSNPAVSVEIAEDTISRTLGTTRRSELFPDGVSSPPRARRKLLAVLVVVAFAVTAAVLGIRVAAISSTSVASPAAPSTSIPASITVDEPKSAAPLAPSSSAPTAEATDNPPDVSPRHAPPLARSTPTTESSPTLVIAPSTASASAAAPRVGPLDGRH